MAVSEAEYLERIKKVHNNLYTYPNLGYTKMVCNINAVCKKHGEFTQKASKHLQGNGCPKCAREKLYKKTSFTTEDFIAKSKEVHGDRYDYSKTVYTKNKCKVEIICKVHGSFWQREDVHRKGSHCPICSKSHYDERRKSTQKKLIEKFKTIHNDFYSYEKVNHSSHKDKVEIICSKHGSFSQSLYHHSQGHGCPSCSMQLSKNQNEINKFINDLGIETIKNDRTIIKPLELDIVIPSHKIAIEYNGVIWHSEKFKKDKRYHQNKTLSCKEAGYRLIHIFEDDYNDNKEKILSYIAHLLGKNQKERVYARKCHIQVIDPKTAHKFLDKYHIQGAPARSFVHIGLIYQNKLVSLTSFTAGQSNTSNKGKFELIRHATAQPVIGALGKATKYFATNYSSDIFTYCDNSFFSGKSYEKAGYVKTTSIDIDYKYVVNGKREHKFLWRKKRILRDFPNVQGKTEKEMMENLGIYRVWDCGKTRYEYVSDTQ